MLKQRKTQILLAIGAGSVALLLGAATAVLKPAGWLQSSLWSQQISSDAESESSADAGSLVLPLIASAPAERSATLQMLASSPPSLDRHRARYLLASDLIQQGQAGSAIPYLEGLEQDYEILAPQILAKRAQAYAASGDATKATATWQELLARDGDDPAAAEALFALGRTAPQQWDQLLQRFPEHPRSLEVAQTRLQQNPNQLSMLLVLARHGVNLPNITAVLDRLTTEYTSQLQPEDWESIAFAYWENGAYSRAGSAYARAPRTPLNFYRAGRGAQLGERYNDARQAYAQLAQAFPTATETATGLLRLASLTQKPQDALPYLEAVMQRFPDRAGEALLEKAKVLEALNSPESASQARQMLLSQYSKTDTAGELRWMLIEQRAAKGDISGAWSLARQLVSENPDSEYAPEAAFWIGKWAQQIGQQQQAKTAFEHVLTHYPHSYYAWRSAAMLGLDVGDFTTVRQRSPEVVKPVQRPALPAGSPVLQELYQLGQDRDAWARWRVEFQNQMQPTVAEQFTDGVMRLGVGDNLDGIFMVSSLDNRTQSEERSQHEQLKQQTAYWQALYPFPFVEPINAWAKERKLNPMLVTALIRQESRFEPKIESSAGALGLMQVMPGTADWVADQIGLTQYAIDSPDDNIKLGTWYLDYTHREYNDNSLFAVASYNAGPGSVAEWIDRFGFSDPDQFVEQIPFPETKGYVESVFENYWNYMRLYNPEVSQLVAKYSPDHAAIVRAPAAQAGS
jgi:soluble lytic murein transglycosylase